MGPSRSHYDRLGSSYARAGRWRARPDAAASAERCRTCAFLFVARTTSAYLPTPAPSLEMWRRVLPLLMQPSMWCANTVKVGTSQSSTGYVLTYCWLTIEIKRPRQNGLFARRSMLRGRVPQKSFELRTACDLARLWAESGERQKARDLLTPVCDWFAEGFETPDLKDGKVLLDELSG